MSIQRLTEADANRSVELYVGDELEVTLPGITTAGFQWEIGAGNVSILRPIGEPQLEASSSAVGSEGKVTLRFEAVGTGRMRLKLIHHRPFEKDTPPDRTFEVTINIKAHGPQ